MATRPTCPATSATRTRSRSRSTARSLDEPFELLGKPVARLTLSCDRPAALLAVRLCELLPDGGSLLITRGILNLCHRESHEHPQPLEPGKQSAGVGAAEVDRALAGGRQPAAAGDLDQLLAVDLAVARSRPTITVHTGAASSLELPVRPPRPEDAGAAAVRRAGDRPAAGRAVAARAGAVRGGSARPRLRRWSTTGCRARFRARSGSRTGSTTTTAIPIRFSIVEGDPLSARVDLRAHHRDRPRRLAHADRDAQRDDLRRPGLHRVRDARRLRGR